MFNYDSDDKIKKSNKYISLISGGIISIGIWVFLDGVISSWSTQKVKFYEFVGPICSLIGFFLINGLPSSMFSHRNSWGEEIECYVKAILVASIILIFGSIVSSVWIFLAVPAFKDENAASIVKWRGVGSMVQSFSVFLATFVWRFMWKDPEEY